MPDPVARAPGGGRPGLRGLLAGLLALWLVAPLVPLAIWSVAEGWRWPDLLPRDWTLDAWRYALSDTGGTLRALWLTTRIAIVVTVLALLAGVPAGRALGSCRFRGRGLVQVVILAPVIVPGIAVVLGVQTVFIGLHLTNSVAGVILVHLIPALPYMVLVMAGVFAGLDPEMEAQARSLGASRLRAFRHVVLPAVRPGLIAGALLVFLVSWSQYVLTLVIGGGRVVTLPLLLFNFATSGRTDIAGAIGVVYVLPGALVLGFAARRLTGRGTALAGIGRP